ncbi:MAG: exodeoxyribonuclease V subunit gamma, partial [Kofleriaceae bacterium]|nr:exodeoxyribonuclease V subunit gamma [Kofleriaceae bacterium]
SESCGVAANLRFPFAQHLVNQGIDSVLPDNDSITEVTRGAMFWSIVEQLNACGGNRHFREIHNYLGDGRGGVDARKKYQLADKIAGLFERYAVYRPELLEGWGRGAAHGWQSELWRGLGTSFLDVHPGARLAEFLSELKRGSGPIEEIPRRLFLFGISALPPLYTRMISAMSSRVEIHAFVLSPSRQYWGDIRRGQTTGDDEEREGNPLLSSLGRLAGDFQQVLEENAEYNEVAEDLYVEPGASSMLSVLQADILDSRCRGTSETPASEQTEDASISIHSCHSPMREMEVLHDQLVSRFEEDPSLDARDVVVMAPDIELYAPAIEAVFSSSRNDRPRIDYSIVDRSVASISRLIQAYSQLIKMMSGRMSTSVVLDLLEHECIRDCFDIAEEDLPLVSKWANESGIRWGVDEEHRKSVGQPELSGNTWRFGLDRLLLGYALPGDDLNLFHGVLGYNDMEGSQAELLGRFVSFCSTLFRARDSMEDSDLLSDRVEWMLELQRSMLSSTEENILEYQRIRDSILELAADANSVGFTGEIPYETLCSLLEKSWQDTSGAQGYLTRGVTFCQLTPMRSIPFRIVCIVGMNDGAFPRNNASLDFDLMATEPRLGDRLNRDDDRYLFLEAILAARDCFLLSYVGQSIKNNTQMFPSVLVGEFLDVLRDSFSSPNKNILDHIVTVHPLQPFSPKYYAPSQEYFSYSKAYCEGAKSLNSPAASAGAQFFSGSLTGNEELLDEIRVQDLISYFQKPTKFLLERRLGIYLRDEEEGMADREPIEMVGLDVWKVANDVLQTLLREGGELSSTDLFGSMRAAGRIPLGTVGECWFEELSEVLDALKERAQEHMASGALDNVTIDLKIGSTRVLGAIDGMYQAGRLSLSYSSLANVSEVGDWIRHLLVNLQCQDDSPIETLMMGRAKQGRGVDVARYRHVDNPAAILASLVSLYRAGQKYPLPLFPVAGRKFVQALKGNPYDFSLGDFGNPNFAKSIQAATTSFTGRQHPAESLDPYVQQVFAEVSCLERDYRPFAIEDSEYRDFTEASTLLFGPLLSHREDERS